MLFWKNKLKYNILKFDDRRKKSHRKQILVHYRTIKHDLLDRCRKEYNPCIEIDGSNMEEHTAARLLAYKYPYIKYKIYKFYSSTSYLLSIDKKILLDH